MSVKLPGRVIDGLDAGMPATDAARRVLKIRLKAVETLLPLSVAHAEEDPEHVHQLRVATRRAGAALRMFKACAGKRARRAMRVRLRRIRRAAARARDLDVLRKLAEERAALMQGTSERVLRDLAEWLGRRRASAQHAIAKAARRHPAKDLRRARQRVIASLRQPPVPEGSVGPDAGAGAVAPVTLGAIAGQRLAALSTRFAEAGDTDLRLVENLHALRLRSKQLRYAFEVLGPAASPEAQAACARVRVVQDRLGAINDIAGFAAALGELVSVSSERDEDWRAAADRLRADVARELAERIESFLIDWETTTSAGRGAVLRDGGGAAGRPAIEVTPRPAWAGAAG